MRDDFSCCVLAKESVDDIPTIHLIFHLFLTVESERERETLPFLVCCASFLFFPCLRFCSEFIPPFCL